MVINMAQITKDSLIGDVLDLDMGTAQYFLDMGMHCLGCPASRGESIEDACMVHGTDCDELVSLLNEYLDAN
jgi:hybrid cluster-associated redox disulfide protein